ncbi:hypothetical protein [Rubritalea marina]|uniref:hypothetical protein n=1 Tax=Rubritalea marina TaxID=361055 RepID=UPI0003AA4D3F|nr:hypothetical protein [Rubritalea marina]
MIKNLLPILALMLVCMPQSIRAQAREVALSLYAFEYAKGHETIYILNKKGQGEAIRLSNANVLGPFKSVINEGGRVALCRKEVDEDGIVQYPILTTVKVPTRVQEPLLVLFPVEGESAYNALVLDRAVANFPYGSYKLINASPYPVRGLVGKTKVFATSKKVTSFQPSFNGKLLDVHFQYKQAPEWKTFGRTRWVEERRQSLLCAYQDPRTKRMKIRGLVLRRQ